MATNSISSQQFVQIKDIKEGIVLMKDGQMCMVLLATSMNFALKAVEEQQAILSQFQALLNTIDFSLQIYVQSRRLDIRPYLSVLAEREAHQDNDLMQVQLREYMEFIRSFTEEVDIMTKNFFVAVPYTPGVAAVKGIKGFLKGSTVKESAEMTDEKFREDRSQLEQRVSVVEQGLARIGIRTAALGTDELIELFYHIYNPEDMSAAPKM